jgi:hypothetical protein
MVHDQHEYRTDNGDRYARDIDACNTSITEVFENCTADNRANNPEHDIENQTLASTIDDLASNEASDKTYYEPRYDSHISSPIVLIANLFTPGSGGRQPLTDRPARSSTLRPSSALQCSRFSPAK